MTGHAIAMRDARVLLAQAQRRLAQHRETTKGMKRDPRATRPCQFCVHLTANVEAARLTVRALERVCP